MANQSTELRNLPTSRDNLPIDRFTEYRSKDAKFEQFNYFLREKIPSFHTRLLAETCMITMANSM